MLNRLNILFFLLIASAFSSCSLEKKLGNKFIAEPPPISIQLFSPDFVYKYNHKGEAIRGFDSLTDAQQDSALFYSSRYMQFISDSAYLEHYMNNFISELRALGFTVYLDNSVDSFLQSQPQSYILNISQVQLDEYYYPFADSTYFGDTLYTMNIRLNAVDASTWFELSKINTQKPVKTTLYSTQSATDAFDGSFVMNGITPGVRYREKTDSLKLKDIYDLAVYSGKKHAGYLFDYFMNQYIAYNMPDGYEILGYYHYNRYRKTLVPTDDERFEILGTK